MKNKQNWKNRIAINKEKTVSILTGMLTVKLLSLGFWRNGEQVAKIVIFATIRDGFQVFCISAMGDADTGDLSLFCHIYCLLLLYDGIIGKLIPGDFATLFHKTDDSLCVEICLRNLIQGLLYKFLSVHMHRSFGVVFATARRICGFTNWRIM